MLTVRAEEVPGTEENTERNSQMKLKQINRLAENKSCRKMEHPEDKFNRAKVKRI